MLESWTAFLEVTRLPHWSISAVVQQQHCLSHELLSVHLLQHAIMCHKAILSSGARKGSHRGAHTHNQHLLYSGYHESQQGVCSHRVLPQRWSVLQLCCNYSVLLRQSKCSICKQLTTAGHCMLGRSQAEDGLTPVLSPGAGQPAARAGCNRSRAMGLCHGSCFPTLCPMQPAEL